MSSTDKTVKKTCGKSCSTPYGWRGAAETGADRRGTSGHPVWPTFARRDTAAFGCDVARRVVPKSRIWGGDWIGRLQRGGKEEGGDAPRSEVVENPKLV